MVRCLEVAGECERRWTQAGKGSGLWGGNGWEEVEGGKRWMVRVEVKPSTMAIMKGEVEGFLCLQTKGKEGEQTQTRQPKPGDLIEIFRFGYQHWAVYVGEEDVVHLTMSYGKPGTGSCCASSFEKAVMRKHKLSSVIDGCRWRINNVLDRKYTPRDTGVIVEEALEEDYSIIKRNCEHIATELRYGKANSRQVSQVTDVLQMYSAFFLHTVLLHSLHSVQLLGMFGFTTHQL
ncbi:Retinoic acid receptor responder protein 3 [Merluccius polli]|uniref:Retinoic acid receptor responder protein 3 n=1 Tax=Merluccius polli TaxID=89951 RepID=A0AA47NZ41_MERPO|nr:Retinoic acid receptor responder protein 3 [Merluccius polli]